MKPQLYMNNSGQSVVEAMSFYKIPSNKVIILFDDICLNIGKIRIRRKGSDGGHNGLKNIQELIGTQDFCRIRIGIGNDFAKGQQVDFVIGNMSAEEIEQVKCISDRVIAGCKDDSTIGPERAMNILNVKNI